MPAPRLQFLMRLRPRELHLKLGATVVRDVAQEVAPARRFSWTACGAIMAGDTGLIESRGNELMLRRKFGNTSLEVSAISLGCWIFGVDWWGHRTQEDCDRMCSF